MEFPRHLHKPDGLYVICPDDVTYEKLTARGWADQPPGNVAQPVEVRLYDALLEPVSEDADAPKRGRKAKAE